MQRKYNQLIVNDQILAILLKPDRPSISNSIQNYLLKGHFSLCIGKRRQTEKLKTEHQGFPSPRHFLNSSAINN